MKDIKVLGSGCCACNDTVALIEEQAAGLGVEVSIEKVTDMANIMAHGVMSTPGVVIDGTVVHSGSKPTADAIKGWLKG